MSNTKVITVLHLIFLIVTPLTILLLPTSFFDEGITLCPSKRFFNFECLGCGMTRAIMHLVHFDFESAVYYNKLSLLVAPILGGYWTFWIIKTILKLRS